jgi:hypothetical protein
VYCPAARWNDIDITLIRVCLFCYNIDVSFWRFREAFSICFRLSSFVFLFRYTRMEVIELSTETNDTNPSLESN